MCEFMHKQWMRKARFPLGEFVRATRSKTRIQQRDWLAKKFAASSTNHVAGFLFSLRVARTNSPSGKRALGMLDSVMLWIRAQVRLSMIFLSVG